MEDIFAQFTWSIRIGCCKILLSSPSITTVWSLNKIFTESSTADRRLNNYSNNIWFSLFTLSFSSLSLGLKKQTLCEESLWYTPLVEVNQAILAWSIRQREIWSQAYTVSQTNNKHKNFTQSITSEKFLNNILLHDCVWQIFTLSLSGLSLGLKKQILCEWSLWYTPLVEVNQAILAWSIRHWGKQSHALSMKFINLCLSG